MSSDQSTDIIEFLRALHPDGSIYEIRSPKCPEWKGGNKLSTFAGWFTDHAAAAKAIEQLEQLEPSAIYVTLNPCNPSLVGRIHNRLKPTKSSTAEENIVKRTALMVDIDPRRLSDTNSTDAQMQAALELAQRIKAELSGEGWPDPLEGMSGNGAYLLYRIDLPNDEASKQLVQDCLFALTEKYSDDGSHVDTSTFDANRICKVLGTMARKGDHVVGVPGVDDMPQRRSWFVRPAGPLQTVPLELLATLAMQRKPEEKPQKKMDSGQRSFDLDAWLAEHNVPVGKAISYAGGRKWIFNELPPPCASSPSGHDCDGSGWLIERSSGVIQAGCRHDRCNWDWKALRVSYEPDAYEWEQWKSEPAEPGVDAYVELERQKSEQEKTACEIRQEVVPIVTTEEPAKVEPPPTSRAGDMFVKYLAKLQAGEVAKLIRQYEALGGLEAAYGQVTVIGGPPGGGKTALVMQVMFDALELNPDMRAVIANAEMSFDVLMRRELTRATRISSDDIRFGNLTSNDLERIQEASHDIIQRLQRVWVLNDPCTLFNLMRLKDEAPGMLLVDYLQKFSPSDKDTKAGVTEVMAGLRTLAKAGWAVLCLSATSRTQGKGGSSHDSQKLNQASFRDSGEIEFNADAAYLLIDNGPLDGQEYIRQMQLRCVKNRHGAKKHHDLIFHQPRMSFEKPRPVSQFAGDFDQYSDNPYSNEPAEASF